jgi:hypothetical protein
MASQDYAVAAMHGAGNGFRYDRRTPNTGHAELAGPGQG